MIVDPIVEEVRAVRNEIARENHYDIATIFATLRKAEADSGTPHITLPPRAVVESNDSGHDAVHRSGD